MFRCRSEDRDSTSFFVFNFLQNDVAVKVEKEFTKDWWKIQRKKRRIFRKKTRRTDTKKKRRKIKTGVDITWNIFIKHVSRKFFDPHMVQSLNERSIAKLAWMTRRDARPLKIYPSSRRAKTPFRVILDSILPSFVPPYFLSSSFVVSFSHDLLSSFFSSSPFLRLRILTFFYPM